jgi:tetratricopeptide (TPR) repeat protein
VPSYEEPLLRNARVWVVLLCWAGCWVLPAVTRAQEAEAPRLASPSAAEPPQAALDHYLRGRRWYLAGRYRDALVELKAALEYDRNSPDLLYNVARVYENLGNFDEAIAYYQRYMEQLPPSANDERDKTEKTVRRLQGAKHEIAQRPATGSATSASVSKGRADWAFWLTGGSACALLAAGGVSGVLALKRQDDVARFVVGPDGTIKDRDKLISRANTFALGSDILLASGAVALTGALLLYFLRDHDTSDRDELRPPGEQPQTQLGFGFDGRAGQLTLLHHF